MIFRVANLPSGQEPYASDGYTDDDNRPGLEIKDHSQKTTWAQYVYDESSESVAIFGNLRSLEDGRIFIKDALDPQSKVTQLDASIPFEIPTDETSDAIKVLFAVQDLAEQHKELKDFLQKHEDTIEYVNRGRK
jgi:hypothetical protein